MSLEAIVRIVRNEVAGFSPEQLHLAFDEAGIDSFNLISIRANIEQFVGEPLSDARWTAVKTVADIVGAVSGAGARPEAAQEGHALVRRHMVGMPQMAMSGLSESWLFKELGDIHWQMITDGLNCPSSELQDGNGNRLYATFTRISLQSRPLSSYRENSTLDMRGRIERFGGGIFFSRIDLTGGRAQIMSSFSMRGESGSNTSLLKGQPAIPPGCTIPSLPQMPEFGAAYKKVKAQPRGDALFTTEYQIVPQYEINGVGLLYFAAYPMISDICEARFGGMDDMSTTSRDIYYFSNSDPREALVFRLHAREADGRTQRAETSISRKSDGALMALIRTSREPA